MNKRIFSLLGFLLLVILSTPQIVALGISPGRVEVAFTPDLERTMEVTIVNTEQKEMDVILYVDGALAPYITLSQERLHFTESETQKSVTYTAILPHILPSPGIHSGQVIARELKEAEDGTLLVTALVAVASGFDVAVPYPGKFVRSTFFVPETKANASAQFLLQAKNLGKEDIKNAKTTVTILDTTGKEVAVVQSEAEGIPAGRKVDFLTEWDVEISYGKYTAKAVLAYDGQRATHEQPFQIGDFILQPLAVSVKNFNLGDVAKFDVLVKNRANQEIQKATAQLTLQDTEGNKIADFSSVDTNINPLAIKSLLAYWDTEQVQQGTYEGKLILRANEGFSENRIRSTVTQKEIKTVFLDITGSVIGAQGSASAAVISKNATIMVVTILIILVNIVGWHMYMKKRGREDKMDDF